MTMEWIWKKLTFWLDQSSWENNNVTEVQKEQAKIRGSYKTRNFRPYNWASAPKVGLFTKGFARHQHKADVLIQTAQIYRLLWRLRNDIYWLGMKTNFWRQIWQKVVQQQTLLNLRCKQHSKRTKLCPLHFAHIWT
jgi:hypothetical protein